MTQRPWRQQPWRKGPARWAAGLGALTVGLLAAPASALDIKGGGQAELGARYGYVAAPGDQDPRDHFGQMGLAIRGLVSNAAVQYGIGLDVILMASGQGPGMRMLLYPTGVGVTLGHSATLGLVLGSGFSGGAGLPWTPIFPAELWLDTTVVGPLWMTGYLRPSWSTEQVRSNGSRTLPFFDELDAGLRFRIASDNKRRFGGSRYNTSSGYFLSLDYGEQLGSRTISIGLGYVLAATAR